MFFAALICIIVFIINLKTQNKPLKQRITYYSKAIALPLFIIIIWILRGILFSGCPAYPSTFGCIDLDWAIPLNYVESELDWILSYARNPNLYPNQVLNSWAWLKPWFESSIAPKKISIMYPMLVSILGVIATTFVAFRNSSFSRISKVILLPLPIIGGLLQWFFTAPSPRFVIALFWILPLAILIILLRFLEIQGKRKNETLIIFSLILNASIAWNLFQDPLFFTRISITQGYEPLPVADLSIQQTDSGLDIWIPKESDQCWNSILPCTPYFKRDLTYINHELFPKFAIQKDVGK